MRTIRKFHWLITIPQKVLLAFLWITPLFEKEGLGEIFRNSLAFGSISSSLRANKVSEAISFLDCFVAVAPRNDEELPNAKLLRHLSFPSLCLSDSVVHYLILL